MTKATLFFRIGDSFYTAGVYCKRDLENSKLKNGFFPSYSGFAQMARLLVTSDYLDLRRSTYLHLRCRIELPGCRRLSALDSVPPLLEDATTTHSSRNPRSKSGKVLRSQLRKVSNNNRGAIAGRCRRWPASLRLRLPQKSSASEGCPLDKPPRNSARSRIPGFLRRP